MWRTKFMMISLRYLHIILADLIMEPTTQGSLVECTIRIYRRNRPKLYSDTLNFSGLKLSLEVLYVPTQPTTIKLTTEQRVMADFEAKAFLSNEVEVYSRQDFKNVDLKEGKIIWELVHPFVPVIKLQFEFLKLKEGDVILRDQLCGIIDTSLFQHLMIQKASQHATELLNKMYLSDDEKDYEIILCEFNNPNVVVSSIRVHKAVIAAASPIVAVGIKEHPTETSFTFFDAEYLSVEGFSAFVKYVYGQLSETDFVRFRGELTRLANKYYLPVLAEACSALLGLDLHTQNVLSRLDLSVCLGILDLKMMCMAYLRRVMNGMDKKEMSTFFSTREELRAELGWQ